MNRQIKILSILLIVTGVISIILLALFFIYVGDNIVLPDIIACTLTLLCVPFTVTFCLIREIRIAKYPLKERCAEVVNLQIRWDHLSKNYDYLATFKISNDLFWTLKVPVEIYNRLAIGQYGKLAYREKNSKLYFVFFSSFNDSNQSR